MSDWIDANQPITLSSEEGIPDNHVITVRERTISIDIPTLIQNNIKTDTVTLDLDAEWNGITPVVIFGSEPNAVEVVYDGPGTIIPSQVAKDVGNVDLSVCGLNADGTVRLVTKAAPGTFSVVKSGLYTGDIPEEDATSILGQLLSAADDARTATSDAKSATSEATKATEETKTATEEAKTATSEAQKAAETANTSASGVQSAIQSANTAAESAQNAADAANTSVENAETAIQNAQTATQNANASAENASEAASNANKAADAANAASELIPTSASAETLEPGQNATATIENKVLKIGVPKGPKGDGVPDGGEPGQVIVKTEEGTAWQDVTTGNVLVGTSSGKIAHAEDAYPAKAREVRIEGKTVNNLIPVMNRDITQYNDMAISTSDDGLITLNGEYTGKEIGTGYFDLDLQDSKTYTVSASNVPDGVNIIFETYNDQGAWQSSLAILSKSTLIKTFTCGLGHHRVRATATKTQSGSTFRIMLVEGEESPGLFTPPGINNVKPEKLVTAGRNLRIDTIAYEGYWSIDNEYVDTSGKVGYKTYGFIQCEPGDTFTAMLDPTAELDGTDNVRFMFFDISGGFIKRDDSYNVGKDDVKTFSIPEGCYNLGWFGGEDEVIVLQIELGSTATEYEPPQFTETALPDGIELRGLQDGNQDVLSIGANGVVIVKRLTVSYEFDGSDDEPWEWSPEYSAFNINLIKFDGDIDSSVPPICDKLGVGKGITGLGDNMCANSAGANAFYIKISDLGSDVSALRRWLSEGPLTCVFTLKDSKPENLDSIDLPKLPAPTFNAYVTGGYIQPTIEVDYERDVNIVVDKIEKALSVTQATVNLLEE